MHDKIHQTILNLLSFRDHSAQEIRQKLRTKSFGREDIEPVITRLTEAGLLNDKRFAENYLRSRQIKGYGPLRIIQELEIRGITHEIIAELIEITDNAWLIAAEQVWKKHFKNKQPVNFKERAKQMRFLQYRGFTLEQINGIFHTSADDISFA
jgi:regulatory protein